MEEQCVDQRVPWTRSTVLCLSGERHVSRDDVLVCSISSAYKHWLLFVNSATYHRSVVRDTANSQVVFACSRTYIRSHTHTHSHGYSLLFQESIAMTTIEYCTMMNPLDVVGMTNQCGFSGFSVTLCSSTSLVCVQNYCHMSHGMSCSLVAGWV